jgi:hypothetical protein
MSREVASTAMYRLLSSTFLALSRRARSAVAKDPLSMLLTCTFAVLAGVLAGTGTDHAGTSVLDQLPFTYVV